MRKKLPQHVEVAIDQCWVIHRPARYRRVDGALRAAPVLILIGVLTAASLMKEQAWAGPAVAVGLGAFALTIGGIIWLNRRGYKRFYTASFDRSGAFLYCLRCQYDLRGCQQPRMRCPECGEAIWRCGGPAVGWGEKRRDT